MVRSVLKAALLSGAIMFATIPAVAQDYDYAVEAYQADDYAEALPIFLELANAGDDDAMWYLGKMYDFGWGVEQSDEKAFNWFKRSADLGDSDSAWEVGIFFETGQGRDKDQSEAFKWYKTAAEGGHVKAMTEIGVRYEDGNGVRQSEKKAFNWFKKAAELGDAKAQAYLGFAYEFGNGVRASDSKAVYWYGQSAEQDYPQGMAWLGEMYESGTGVPEDRSKAIDLYQRAAAEGNSYALERLSALGVEPPSADATTEVSAASPQSGYVAADTSSDNCDYDLDMDAMAADCQYGVALRLVQDLQAYDAALPILNRLSNENQHADAAHLLGVMYSQAEGWTSVSETESFKHYLIAADRGHPEAQAMVGGAYLVGQMGQQKDQTRGLDYIKRAARQGHQRSRDFLTSQNITW